MTGKVWDMVPNDTKNKKDAEVFKFQFFYSHFNIFLWK